MFWKLIYLTPIPPHTNQTSQSGLIHLQKLLNQSMLNGALEIISNAFSESNKNFGRLVVEKFHWISLNI